jgi:PEP-CTERM motif
MRRFGLRAIFILAVLVVLVRMSRADSIVLTSPAPGVYGYGFELDPGSPGLMAVTGDTLTFTGLFGVTGASAAPGIGFTSTFTSTSATFTETGGGASSPNNPGSTPIILPDFFFIDSADTTIGSVSYVATTSNQGVLSGTAEGPVAPAPAVPEPSSLILASSGLLGLAGIARRKFVR